MNRPLPAERLPLVRSPRTLRRRLQLFLLPALLGLFLLSLVVAYRLAFDPVTAAYDHALEDDALALVGRIHVRDAVIDVDLPAAAEAVLRSDRTDVEYFVVRGPAGELLAGDADLLPDPASASGQGSQNLRLSDGWLRGKTIRKVSYHLETARGRVSVAVAETTQKRDRAASKIMAGMVLPGLLLILFTLVLVQVGVRRGLAPLTALSEEIRRRSAHDLSPLPPREVPGEAEPLVRAMDELITDLRVAASAQQAFLANAAHQLKTPLAGLQTQLELAAEEIPPAQRRRIDQLREATRRLAHLAHQLLALARSAPEANIAHEHRALDLQTLFQDEASAWFDLALAKGVDIGFEPEAAPVRGSPWLLRELLTNLVDNAVRYTPPGGRITVRCGSVAGEAYLEVEDDGPGIPPEARQRVFERFYRPEGSPGAGTGLGLAIVKEVAERHGARLHLESGEGGRGTRIRVSFGP